MKHCIIIIAILFCGNLKAQQYSNEPSLKFQRAIELMDSGKIDSSLQLMYELVSLDSGNINYQYRIGYAYFLDNNFQNAIDLLKKLSIRQDAFDRIYQTLGNCYYNLGQINEAASIYEQGLKMFPESGCLNFELGLINIRLNNTDKAIKYLTKGIEGEPGYSLNYYLLAKLFINSTNMVWGFIYGEIFINLEHNNSLTEEMSMILYNSYLSGITVKEVAHYFVKFTEEPEISKRYKIPFSMIYETIILHQIKKVKKIDLKSLNQIRTGFLKSYYNDMVNEIFPSNIYGQQMAPLNDKVNDIFPNCLFDYQNQLLEKGHLEAYSYWLLGAGDEKTFISWKESNKKEWERFINWFENNKLIVDDGNKFVHISY